MDFKTNIIIVGTGIGGLSLAIKLAESNPNIKIDLISKNKTDESNTRYAQGGIAIVTDFLSDSFEKHISDTLIAGNHLNNKSIVDLVIKSAPKQLQTLKQWGVSFDSTEKGELIVGLEGGHSQHRILHHKDQTGKHLLSKLFLKISTIQNIQQHQYVFASDLIVKNGHCQGLTIVHPNNNEFINIKADTVVLATGGIGQVYKTTTNPLIATGDGITMAARAGATIKDMEFIQFHPTALFTESNPVPLISEAVRGYGAILLNVNYSRFMENEHPLKELAPRDIVSRSIFSQMQSTKTPYVLLDCTHFKKDAFAHNFPHIKQLCNNSGIDPTLEPIPVCPAAHYLCGGIEVNCNGETSIPNLFAIGECAKTGLHGSNRLASNSLLEAIVFAEQCCRSILKLKKSSSAIVSNFPIIDQFFPKTRSSDVESLINGIKDLMNSHLGIIKTNKSLLHAKNKINLFKPLIEKLTTSISNKIDFLELRNMVTVCELIINQSKKRTTNTGTFYNSDLLITHNI